ncbi:MAG TPA: FtsX-like permease family protein, partial [Bryobacteraceae bacterium]|nr:FtsX-like permease family protein [Bryobacteraceae bacterium]
KVGGPYADGSVVEIVGVTGDVSQEGLDQKPDPMIFFPFRQSISNGMVVMIRTAGDPAAIAPAVRRQVLSMDRNLPIQSLKTMEQRLEAPLEQRRFETALLAGFAALAMLLAGVGIYGLLKYWVSVRENEIAIRVALGAQPKSIVGWAGSHVLRLAAVGIALGLVGAWVAARWVESLVFGVSARDLASMVTGVAVVLGIAVIASAVPVWRATRVDPVSRLQRG